MITALLLATQLTVSPPLPASPARHLWRQALSLQAQLDHDAALRLLRAARAADSTFFPAQYEYIQLMREYGFTPALRREYPAATAESSPLYACLAAVARAPYHDGYAATPIIEQLEWRGGRAVCTTVFLAHLRSAQAPWAVWRREAPDYWSRAVQAAPEVFELWLHLISAYQEMGRLRDVELTLVEAERYAPSAGDREFISLWLTKVRTELRTGQAAAAMRTLTTPVRRSSECSRFGTSLGSVFSLETSLSAQQARWRELGAVARDCHAWRIEWRSAFRLGSIMLESRGNPRAALDHYSRAVKIADSAGARVLSVMSYTKRGRTYSMMGASAEAERDLLRALDLARDLGEPYVLAEAYHILAHTYESAGRLDEAARTANRFIASAALLSLPGTRLISFHDAGTIQWKAGWHAAANVTFAEMVRIAERHERELYWAGEYFERIGDLDRAIDFYRRGLVSGESPALNFAGLARAFEALGFPDSAEAVARSHDRMMTGALLELPLLPGILARRGRLAEAIRITEDYARTRSAQGHLQGAARTWLQLGELLLQSGNAPAAMRAALRAESLSVRMTLTEELIRARALAGTARARSGDLVGALPVLNSAAELVRQHPTAGLVVSVQTALADVLAAAGRTRAALLAYDAAARQVERSTHLLARDLDRVRYRETNLAPFDGALRTLLGSSGSAHDAAALSRWSQRWKAAALAIAAEERRERHRSPRILSLSEVQDRLAAPEALIDYVVIGPNVAAIVVTHRAATVVRLAVSMDSVRGWADALRQPLVSTYAGQIDFAYAPFDLALAERLHAALLAPIASLVAGKTRLIIAADGPLYYVPFDALVEAAPPAATNGSAMYLGARYALDRFEIIYVPAAHLLPDRATRSERFVAAGAGVLAIAGDAPGADREVETIRSEWRRTGHAAARRTRHGDRGPRPAH